LSQIDSAGLDMPPSEILVTIMAVDMQIRASLEAEDGQMASMDDVLPAWLFVLARSSLLRPCTCASLLMDSMTLAQRSGIQGMAVVNFESAAHQLLQEDLSQFGGAVRAASVTTSVVCP
jgi:hypothetical protein